MGSWHGTCGVTDLPLRSDDPVRVALLAFDNEPPKDWRSGFCNPSDIAFPITPLLPGTYDDYGGAMLGALDEPMQFAVKHCLFPIPEGEGDMQETLRDGKLKFRTFRGMSKVGIFMVREDVYQHMLHDVVDRDGHSRGPKTFEEFRAAADLTVADLLAISKAIRESDDDSHTIFKAVTYWWDWARGPERNLDLRREFDFATVNFRQGLDNIKDRLSDLASHGSTTAEALQPYAYALADALKFEDAMQVLRRSYAPPTGAGSSSENRQAHRSLAKLTLAALDAMDERDREEFGEDESGEAA